MEDATVNNRERLPSDLNQVLTVAKYDVLKHFRSKRLLGLLVLEGLVLALMFALPIALDLDTSDDAAGYMSSYVGWVSMLIVIGATMFAGMPSSPSSRAAPATCCSPTRSSARSSSWGSTCPPWP